MKIFWLILLSFSCLNAAATPVDDLLAKMKSADEFQRYDLSYNFCARHLEKSNLSDPARLAAYREAILALGEAWRADAELPFQVLSDCQGLWKAKHLDPMMNQKINDVHERLRVDNLIAADGLFGVPQYLRESIRLFLTTSQASPAAPPAPFEILSGLASSDRQLAASLEVRQREMSAMFTSGAAAAGVVGFELAAGVLEFTRVGTLAVSRVYWPVIAVWLGTEAIKALEENRLWQNRRKELKAELRKIALQLQDPASQVPQELLLQEFEKMVRVLAFFYSYDLLGDEVEKKRALPSGECLQEIHAYFNDKTCPTDQIRERFEAGRECTDAANTWVGASLFLQKRFPKSAQARLIASEMMNDAKHAVQLYQITIKRQTEQFECQQKWGVMRAEPVGGYTCDPVTGNPLF